MRYFHALVVVLLGAITLELGMIIINLPTPTAQAQLSAPSALPAMTAEHLELKKQLDALSSMLSAKIDAKVDALMTNMKNYDDKTRSRFSHLSSVVYFCTGGGAGFVSPNGCAEQYKKSDW